MLPVVVVKIAQIAVGVAVGNVANNIANKYVVEPIQKKIEIKKMESRK